MKIRNENVPRLIPENIIYFVKTFLTATVLEKTFELELTESSTPALIQKSSGRLRFRDTEPKNTYHS